MSTRPVTTFNLKWEVIETAGKMGSVEVFLNFMIMDINRNALRKNGGVSSKVDQLFDCGEIHRVGRCCVQQRRQLFEDPQKVSNARFEEAFRERLKKKAGFKYVSPPMPMKTKTNSVTLICISLHRNRSLQVLSTRFFDKYRKLQGL